MSSTTIYQRTQAGRDEIYNKAAELTQSERQVLIMIDGVTPCRGVRSKLAALSDERFERAVRALEKKELISEVFLPIPGQEAEQIETAVVDRFLQQEPTDPVTIISYDPEEDFGEIQPQSSNALAPPIPELDVIVSPEPALDEAYARMADTLQHELQARKVDRQHSAGRLPSPRVLPEVTQKGQGSAPQQRPEGIGMHWGYWLIGLGIVFIVGFTIARFTAH